MSNGQKIELRSLLGGFSEFYAEYSFILTFW
jgi:hypothetical protein